MITLIFVNPGRTQKLDSHDTSDEVKVEVAAI